MGKNFNWRIKKEYYNLILKGIKTLEVRVGYPDIKRVKAGDTITFKDYSNVRFRVVRVTRYNDFCDMLDTEDSSKAIPNISKYKALEMYQEIYPEDKEALGVYVFELAKWVPDEVKQASNNEIKYYSLAALKNKGDYKMFSSLVGAAYNVTNHICTDYPNHFKWYWTKQVPRIFEGTGDVIVCIANNLVIGISFVKKDEQEAKICTFFVSEKYRGKQISDELMEYSFKFLGTKKPLITIPDYKVNMFNNFIMRYNWELTQTTRKGYYNDSSCEYVYNGKLPD